MILKNTTVDISFAGSLVFGARGDLLRGEDELIFTLCVAQPPSKGVLFLFSACFLLFYKISCERKIFSN